MDTMLNIFSATDPAFSNITLTSLVNQNFPYVPGYLTDLNLTGTPQGMLTLSATFEDVSAGIRMISASPRGAPPSESAHVKGNIKALTAYHFAREITVNADELLGIRARGTMNPQTLQNLLLERTDGPVGVKMQLALSKEHWLLGLVQGRVYDADGSTRLWDYYDWTSTSRPTALNLPISSMTANADSGILKQFGLTLRRSMINALNGFPLGSTFVPYVLCGDNFFDGVATSPEVVRATKLGAFGNPAAAIATLNQSPFSVLDFADVRWVNYRGTADGPVSIDTDSATAFPAGVPGLYQEFYAPADTFETVTSLGLPYYMLNDPNNKSNDKRAVFELQSNPLLANLRPTACIPITKS